MKNHKQYSKTYYEKNIEKRREDSRERYYRNIEHNKARQRAYYQKNREAILLKAKEKRPRKTKPKKQHREEYNSFKEATGCLNPECQWKGPYTASMLDFHHIGEKLHDVSQIVFHPKLLKAEIEKCTMLCANCHRLVTYNKLDDRNLPLCKFREAGV